jgi:hypothetical protein
MIKVRAMTKVLALLTLAVLAFGDMTGPAFAPPREVFVRRPGPVATFGYQRGPAERGVQLLRQRLFDERLDFVEPRPPQADLRILRKPPPPQPKGLRHDGLTGSQSKWLRDYAPPARPPAFVDDRIFSPDR